MNNKFYSFLNIAKKAGVVASGYNKCEENLKRNRAYLLIIAEELSDNSKKKFLKICEENNIKVIQGISQQELNEKLNTVDYKVLCITNKAMSKNIVSLWENQN